MAATQQESPGPSAEVVGHAFVEQYYSILHQSPALVHRFYQDSSLLTRPDSSSNMATVTTLQEINDKIISLKYEDYTAEIETTDAQESFGKGVIVLVTGCLTGKDGVRKRFTQTFFLAPQDPGYYVLNDVFRYLEDKELSQIRSEPVNGISDDALASSQIVEPEHDSDRHEPEPVASIEVEEYTDNVAEVCDPSDKDEGSVVEDEIVELPPTQLPTQSSETQTVSSADSAPVSQENPPKISYASVVKVMKSNPIAQVTAYKPRAPPAQAYRKLDAPHPKSAIALEGSAPSSENAPDSTNSTGEDDGHSIYVRNLPFDATTDKLEEIFKKFGPIKHGGIQVRSNKQGFCFGFVEFETSTGKRSALEASSITVGDQLAVVEEKKTNSRGGNTGRGRYSSSGRGGYRSENFKGGRGGRGGYGRGDFRNSGDFQGKPRNEEEGYQRYNRSGNVRGGRGGGGAGSRGGLS